MTHEELVEKVAFILRHDGEFQNAEECARESIKIVGEACAESAGVIVEHHRKVVEATDDNEVRHARYNAQTAAGVVQNRILSLTQGTKE